MKSRLEVVGASLAFRPPPSRHRHIPARPVRPHPEGDPSRAAHAPAGRAPSPQDEARPALAGDAFQVGPDAQLAQLALGVDQPAVGEDGADRMARLPPVRRRVTVGIASGHLCMEGALTLATRSLAA